MKKKTMLTFGTTLELIKMCPLVNEFETKDSFQMIVLLDSIVGS